MEDVIDDAIMRVEWIKIDCEMNIISFQATSTWRKKAIKSFNMDVFYHSKHDRKKQITETNSEKQLLPSFNRLMHHLLKRLKVWKKYPNIQYHDDFYRQNRSAWKFPLSWFLEPLSLYLQCSKLIQQIQYDAKVYVNVHVCVCGCLCVIVWVRVRIRVYACVRGPMYVWKKS